MTITHDEMLSADELHTMLAMHHLVVTPDSPLVGLPTATSVVTSEALEERGLLRDEWTTAMRTLHTPTRCFRMLKAFPGSTVVTAYYGNGTSDAGLIGCWAQGDKMRIGLPYTVDDLLEDSSLAMGVDLAMIRDPFNVDLSLAGLVALSSAIDVMRQRLLRSILDRDPDVDMRLWPKQLHKAYASGLAGTDARWLVTLMHILMPTGVARPESLTDAGMAELLQAGLIQIEHDHWRATDTLARLTAYLKTPLPAVAHEAIVLGPETHYNYTISIRGDGPTWVFQFWQEAETVGITIRSRMGGSYRRQMFDMLAPVFAPVADETPATDSASAPVKRFCTKCGAATRPGDAFCTNCGRKL